jgi:hypothetical protein
MKTPEMATYPASNTGWGNELAMADKPKVPGSGSGAPSPPQDTKPPDTKPPEPTKALPRKIIYNADLSFIVKNLEESEQELNRLIKQNEGIIAMAEISGTSGARRHAYWKIRVPVDRFDSLVDGLARLGIPEKNKRDSQDVSEEYYDLTDRIKNKKLEQETLRGYLQEKKTTSKLEEILLIEKELARVRDETDLLEGRLRRLKDLTALATVTITLQEIKDYVPPQAPSFGNTITTTFIDSVDALAAFGKFLTLAVVGLVPWLPVIAILVVPFWLIWRQQRQKRAGAKKPIPTAQSAEGPGTPAK